MSDHTVTEATSRSTSRGASAAERVAEPFGFGVVHGDADRRSVFATIDERVQATHEGDVPPHD